GTEHTGAGSVGDLLDLARRTEEFPRPPAVVPGARSVPAAGGVDAFADARAAGVASARVGTLLRPRGEPAQEVAEAILGQRVAQERLVNGVVQRRRLGAAGNSPFRHRRRPVYAVALDGRRADAGFRHGRGVSESQRKCIVTDRLADWRREIRDQA